MDILLCVKKTITRWNNSDYFFLLFPIPSLSRLFICTLDPLNSIHQNKWIVSMKTHDTIYNFCLSLRCCRTISWFLSFFQLQMNMATTSDSSNGMFLCRSSSRPCSLADKCLRGEPLDWWVGRTHPAIAWAVPCWFPERGVSVCSVPPLARKQKTPPLPTGQYCLRGEVTWSLSCCRLDPLGTPGWAGVAWPSYWRSR